VFSRKIEPAPDFFDALAVELAYCHEKPTKVSSTNKVVLTTQWLTAQRKPRLEVLVLWSAFLLSRQRQFGMATVGKKERGCLYWRDG